MNDAFESSRESHCVKRKPICEETLCTVPQLGTVRISQLDCPKGCLIKARIHDYAGRTSKSAKDHIEREIGRIRARVITYYQLPRGF